MSEFKKKFTTQLGISFGLVVICSGLLIYFYSDLRAVGKSIEERTSASKRIVQEIEGLSILRRDAAEINIIMDQLRNVLPNRELLFAFSEEVNRIARARNLNISFTFGNEALSESSSMPHKIGFVVNVRGERDQILLFLNDFESSRYFTRVKSFELLAQGVGETAYQATLSGEVFFSN